MNEDKTYTPPKSMEELYKVIGLIIDGYVTDSETGEFKTIKVSDVSYVFEHVNKDLFNRVANTL